MLRWWSGLSAAARVAGVLGDRVPNSRNAEVRARCAIRGVPCLGAANRLDSGGPAQL